MAAHGLDVAVCGYAWLSGNHTPAATRAALNSGGGHGARVVCGAFRATQADFDVRYTVCDGAMMFFTGALSGDPGFRVPAKVVAD